MDTVYYYPYWQLEHYWFLMLTIATPALLLRLTRLWTDAEKDRVAKYIALVLVINWIVYQLYRVINGFWELKFDLPMELCNWAVFLTAAALWYKRQRWAELAFFWVMAGSVHGIITPDIHEPFPHLTYITFVVGHGGLVLGVFYAVFGLKLKPQRGAFFRALLYSQLYLIIAFIINWMLGANYGYLMQKPAGGSFLDLLHPWPYYLLELEVMGCISYGLLYLPFWWSQRDSSVLK
jgi:hypothetical integral membrane protein (TIGR02206 family)